VSAPTVEAVVLETLPNSRFRCRADDGSEVTCHVGGGMRLKVVRVLPGETVVIEPSPKDPTKGRIVGKGRSRS
jgi:translation initiation factor IF-1